MDHQATHRPLLRAAAFLLGLTVLLWLAGCVLRPKDNTPEAGMSDPEAMGILAEPEDSIEAIFIGDSLTYAGISPMEIWRAHGIPTYVCGTTKQRTYQGYAILRQALRRQSPAVVVLEPHTLFQPTSLSSALARELYPYLPAVEYHDRWKSLRAEDFIAQPEYSAVTTQKGYKFRTQQKSASGEPYMLPSDETESISWLNRLYFHRMAALCREKGCELALISVPSEQDWSYAKHNAVQALAEEYGLTYVDLNLMPEEVPIDWKTDSRDHGDHLNYYGAKKVSRWLGDYLQERYAFADRRADEGYAMWNVKLEAYEELTQGA